MNADESDLSAILREQTGFATKVLGSAEYRSPLSPALVPTAFFAYQASPIDHIRCFLLFQAKTCLLGFPQFLGLYRLQLGDRPQMVAESDSLSSPH
jgi:hypothetical protein